MEKQILKNKVQHASILLSHVITISMLTVEETFLEIHCIKDIPFVHPLPNLIRDKDFSGIGATGIVFWDYGHRVYYHL